MTDPADGILALLWMTGWSGASTLPVFLDGASAPAVRLRGSAVELAQQLAVRSRRWDFERSLEVAIGLPEPTRECTVLWCWLETQDQVRRAARFRPVPSLVLRMGRSCRRLAFWALDKPWSSLVVEPSNKRLAYALHAPQKWADPTSLRIPVPGTFLRVGRARPSPVLLTRATHDVWPRAKITGRLKDPPPPYMQRLREGTVKR